MTTIDLNKSKFFLRDLEVVKGQLTKLNSVDFTIQRITAAMESFILNPEAVDHVEVNGVLNIAREISKSYDKETVSLTNTIDRLIEELAHLELSQRIAGIVDKSNLFYKLASGK